MKVHYAKYSLIGVKTYYAAACGWFRWNERQNNITTTKSKVTCKNCKRTGEFRGIK